MALALRTEDPIGAEIIQELEHAQGRNDAALRRAVPYAAVIAPAVIELAEKAAATYGALPTALAPRAV
jgi:hypothetical protein